MMIAAIKSLKLHWVAVACVCSASVITVLAYPGQWICIGEGPDDYCIPGGLCIENCNTFTIECPVNSGVSAFIALGTYPDASCMVKTIRYDAPEGSWSSTYTTNHCSVTGFIRTGYVCLNGMIAYSGTSTVVERDCDNSTPGPGTGNDKCPDLPR